MISADQTALAAELHSKLAALDGRPSGLLMLLRYRWQMVLNQLRNLHRESLLKIVVVTALGIVFWAGLFGLFLHGFQFVNDHAGFIKTFLVRNVLSLFFMAILFMLIFSNAVISFSNLFRSPETAFLFSLPLRHDTIFAYKLFESLVFSSWAVFALGLPLLLAYGLKSNVEWYFYPMIIVFMGPFVLLPAAIGAMAGLVLTAILPRHGGKVLVLAGVAIFAIFVYIAITVFKVKPPGGYAMEMQASVQAILGRLSFTQNILTPNYWITEGLLGIGEGRGDGFRAGAHFFFALTSSALFFSILGWFVSGYLYDIAYSIASASDHIRRVVGRTTVDAIAAPLQQKFPGVVILLVKDVKTFLRDPAQWSQVLIFFGILMLYIGNLRNFSYPLQDPFYQNLISFLNLGASCMTLATMTSRFVFPMISLEGRRFWILGLVPLNRREIMMSKFYFALIGSLLLTTSLVLLSNYILENNQKVLWIQLVTSVLISFSLSGLSVGMGAIFPSFNERNPSKIVSGFGGTLTLIIAITLVIMTIMVEGLLCHFYYVRPVYATTGIRAYLPNLLLAGVIFVLVMNIVAAWLPMRLGIRSLQRVEF